MDSLKNNRALVFLVLLGMTTILFGQILNNDFWTAAEYEYLAKSLTVQPAESFFKATLTSHPIVTAFHRFEYTLFGDKPTGYYLLNILIHTLNAFLLYLLVHLTLKDFGIALMSATLFAFSVGNYGKEVMYAAGVSGILMHTVFLLTVLCYAVNEIKCNGKVLSIWFLFTMLFFTTSIINRYAFLSGVGVLLAYNIFFKKDRQRPIFVAPLIILLLLGGLLAGFQLGSFKTAAETYPEGWGFMFFMGNFFSNIPAYIIHMVYPLHYNPSIEEHSIAALIYSWKGWMRPLLGLFIFSYAAYGFVFGNTNLRFFIAWSFVTIIPFCFFHTTGDWLNTKYLYIASAGFCLILATGTMKMYSVLRNRSWRRFIPILIPAFFMALSAVLIHNLDKTYEARANLPETLELKEQFLDLKRRSLQAEE